MKKYFPILTLCFLFLSANLSKADDDRQTEITLIKINGQKISLADTNDITLSNSDSINIFYGCRTADANKDLWLFKIKLKLGSDENATNIQQSEIAYKNLNEGDYSLSIQAFMPAKWNANPVLLHFRVNNKEADLKKQLKQAKIEKEKADSLEKKARTQASSDGASIWVIALIGALLGIIIAIIGVVVFILWHKIQRAQTMSKDKKDPKSASNLDLEKLTKDNNELRTEIVALRGQIDALQNRALELNENNKQLEDKVSRVSEGKKELEDLQKQKDELFAMIIHDIKNPVSLIKSLVELLRSYDLNAVEQQEIIDDIVETTAKIVSLSQEVSKILVLESSTFQLNFDEGPISEVVSSVYRRNLSAAQQKAIQMFLEIDENLPLAKFDSQKLEEVIDNLLSNAVKFSHKGGTIRIRAHSVEKNIVIEISDNGLGLSEEDIKRAFTQGGKLSAKPTAGEPSSGLGLWIVKKIIDAHKGRVWVRSALGKGSTFSFSIPIDPEHAVAEE